MTAAAYHSSFFVIEYFEANCTGHRVADVFECFGGALRVLFYRNMLLQEVYVFIEEITVVFHEALEPIGELLAFLLRFDEGPLIHTAFIFDNGCTEPARLRHDSSWLYEELGADELFNVLLSLVCGLGFALWIPDRGRGGAWDLDDYEGHVHVTTRVIGKAVKVPLDGGVYWYIQATAIIVADSWHWGSITGPLDTLNLEPFTLWIDKRRNSKATIISE